MTEIAILTFGPLVITVLLNLRKRTSWGQRLATLVVAGLVLTLLQYVVDIVAMAPALSAGTPNEQGYRLGSSLGA